MTRALEALRVARDIVREGWTRGCAARDAAGRPCLLTAFAAVRFCAVAALAKCGGYDNGVNAATWLFRAVPDWRRDDFSEWEDEPLRTHAEVIAAFDAAISLCSSASDWRQ